jgi:hypothetical protein
MIVPRGEQLYLHLALNSLYWPGSAKGRRRRHHDENLRHTDVRGGQKPAETQGTTEESIIQELCITADKWFGSGESFFQGLKSSLQKGEAGDGENEGNQSQRSGHGFIY